MRDDGLKSLGMIARHIVHELRNPLNAIRMQAAVVQSKISKPSEENLQAAHQQLQRLEAEVLRLEQLAQSFLDYGRPLPDNPEAFSALALLEEVAELIRPEFEAAEQRVVVQLHGTGPGDFEICMDRGRLRRAILNLARNARQAMSAGGQLTLGMGSTSGGERVVIEIADTGCGIAPANLATIFEPLYSGTGGTGMGLAITKEIIESSGGVLRVESVEGEGTRFQLEVPALAAVDDCDDEVQYSPPA